MFIEGILPAQVYCFLANGLRKLCGLGIRWWGVSAWHKPSPVASSLPEGYAILCNVKGEAVILNEAERNEESQISRLS